MIKMDNQYNRLIFDKMSEINTMKKVAATENFLINDQSGMMQSSVLKALDFSLNIDIDDIAS